MSRISRAAGPLRIILILALFLTASSTLVSSASSRGEMSTLLQGLNHPVGVDVDLQGNVYFTEYGAEGAGILKRMLPDGRVEVAVSNLTTPTGVAVDSQGNVYFAESAPGTVKRLQAGSGKIDVILGDFPGAWGLAVDSVGNTYVSCKSVNGSLVKISAGDGEVTTLAGGLDIPYDVSVDVQGNVFFVEYGGTAANGTLKKLLHGVGEPVTLLEGLMYPYAVASDAEGDLYFTEKTGALKRLSVGETEPTLMLQGLGRVYGLTVDGRGDVYFVTFGSPIGDGGGTLNKLSFVPLPKKPSQIMLASSATSVDVGEAFNVTGRIDPRRAGYPVELTYLSPDGETTRKTVYSSSTGEFMDTFSPSLAGVWVVSAEWPGDVEYEGAVSPSVSVKVGGNEGLGLGVAEVAVISGVAAVAVIAAVLAVSKSRRRKAEVRRRGKKKKGSR